MIREDTMASLAVLGGPLAWAIDLMASYALLLRSTAAHASGKLEVHVVTLAVTAVVAIVGLFSWRALRVHRGRSSEGWRFVAASSLMLNVLFLVTITATALLRLIDS